MIIKGVTLFVWVKCATFLLDVYFEYGKKLLPDEVQRLLSGEILTKTSLMLTIDKVAEVQIGESAKYPT